MEYRRNIKPENNLINLNECQKKINDKNIFIGKGGQGSIYKLESEKCGGIVLKTYHKKTNQKEIYREINILDRVKNLIEKDICPHFLYYYDFFKKDNDINILMEYADGDLEKWIKNYHSDDEWKNMIFQFIIGVHTIQKYLKGYHSDLKPKNIFFKNINHTDTYFKYLVDNKEYYIKNNGNLFILADYGHFQSIFFDDNTITEENILSAIRENQDFDYLKDLPKRIKVTNLLKKYNLKYIKNKFINNKNFNSYYNTEYQKINKEMNNYPINIKDKFLNRNLLYYCLEEKLIDYEKEVNNGLQEEQKSPSEYISTFINNILNEKGDIENILDTYFKEYQEKKDNISKVFNLNKII